MIVSPRQLHTGEAHASWSIGPQTGFACAPQPGLVYRNVSPGGQTPASFIVGGASDAESVATSTAASLMVSEESSQPEDAVAAKSVKSRIEMSRLVRE